VTVDSLADRGADQCPDHTGEGENAGGSPARIAGARVPREVDEGVSGDGERAGADRHMRRPWKRMRPSVVSASKSGATSLICSDISFG
jgi:hypothetical protein